MDSLIVLNQPLKSVNFAFFKCQNATESNKSIFLIMQGTLQSWTCVHRNVPLNWDCPAQTCFWLRFQQVGLISQSQMNVESGVLGSNPSPGKEIPERLKEWTQFSSPHMKWQTECQYLHPDFLRAARAALDWAIRTKQGHCIHKWANAASIDCAHIKGGDVVPCGWASFSENSYFLSSGFWTQHLVGVREFKSEGHTVYFLISSFECEWFKLVWPNWSREAKISLSYLTHVCERALFHRLVQSGPGDAHSVLFQITLCHRWPDPRECIIDVKEFW